MKPKFILLACILVCFLAGPVFGAITGDIKGKITDSKTGEPLSGVSVSIKGTTMGAKTHPDGEYIVINVPVGDYTLVFSSIGYSTLEVENVHVSAELISFQDRKLEEEVTDLGKVVTVRAERPLIQVDKTTTVNIVTANELQAMPVRGFEQAVSLQNSVVRMLINNDTNVRLRGQRESNPTAGELNLRGGRPSEVAYYVDGFSQQDPLTGISTSNIANNAIQEVQVTSGAFSAEYGHVASGIVNVVTKSGGDKYSGTVDIVTDNFLSKSYDQNYYSLDFGGPLPGLENAYFFLSGERRWLADRAPSVKTEEFYEAARLDTNSTLDFEDLNRQPANSLAGWSGQAKLDFELSSAIKLALTGTGSFDKWQEYQHNYLFNNRHSPRYEDKNYGLNAKITHNMDANTYYNFSASYFMTERLRGDGVIFDDLAAYVHTYAPTGQTFANPEWEDLNLFRDNAGPIFASTVDTSVAQGDPGDTVLFLAESHWNNYLHRKSSYIGFKGDFNKQIGLDHTVKAGFDFERHTLRYFEHLNPTNVAGYRIDEVNRYGFDEFGVESDDEDYRNDTKHPFNVGLYIKDRFDWAGLIIDAGLRFDYFDYKSLRIKDLRNPLDPGNATGIDTLDPGDLEDSKVFTRLSPRLGISFPITEKTQLHINYGKFYQRPDLLRLYTGYDFMADRIDAGSYYPFPSPNLEPEKITQYEAGLTHQIGENTAFGLTAYYKDVQDLTQIFHQTPASPNVYDYFGNTDYGTVKGIDLNLAMRRARNLRLDLKYTLSWATGTGSYAQSQYNVAWQNPLFPPKSTAPLDYDKRHSLLGLIDFRTGGSEGPRFGESYPLENLSLNIIAQASSGTPYTRMDIFDGATEAAVNPVPRGKINATNLPWTFNIDLKLERAFTIGQFNVVPYLWVQNLLDRENVAIVYEGSGKADVTGWLGTEEGQGFVEGNAARNGEYMYDLKQSNPRNYGPPRIILLGVRMAF
jgi:outer membrane receptor protein involved in Fe transport